MFGEPTGIPLHPMHLSCDIVLAAGPLKPAPQDIEIQIRGLFHGKSHSTMDDDWGYTQGTPISGKLHIDVVDSFCLDY